MPLTILSQEQLRSLLLSLSRDQIVSLQENLARALRDYSTGSQEKGCAATYQPQRTAITRPDGCTTVFMPASTGPTLGMKVISLQDKNSQVGCTVDAASKISPSDRTGVAQIDKRKSLASIASDVSELSLSSQEGTSTSNSLTMTNSGGSGSGSSSSKSLAAGCVNQQPVAGGLSKTMGAWPSAGSRDTSPQGSVTLLDGNSLPFGLINAHELTPFRTALTSLMTLNKRKRVRTIVVFGAGKQAYWHIRLALVLRSADVKRVYIINRSFDRAAQLLRDIYSPENSSWRGDVKFSAVSSDFVEYPRILHDALRKADAIFCCTPAVDPLFPAEILTAREGRQKGRLISAIGSYKPHMTELPPDLLRDEVSVHTPGHRHFHKHIKRSGVVVVDSLDAALKEAGEIVQAGIKPHQVVELGELLIVRESSHGDADSDDHKSLREWVERGNVIFKSVGMGLMDLVTGGDLIQLAREKNIGTTIAEF
ncbi:proline utilization protein PrnX-like protein [Aspergillus uvarum CBS 121591]|uniref:Proline utilization protein PrnX-like protein n=3 Tax=Aspergillus TaxID=5052 RepID=A0A319BZL1_9EURO|nr:proline utilization protein PrnX-like protein [Aspergillus uvarum CBS 121591]XP_025521711.1 proline utilization protein PrnX-like protein [Aspergillus japonicus CBS 114.51]PYH78244.1 proline utilization protein PrnX-like protein [Aspergillus uvarum CBS 121591]PYI24594.1 proline utilization protein PrnX-like protein [Aspergillus violaceofuscus CBS 115571]RAH75817.1 proline utilization protein PrnX-like protein [Aspergillus japonicus CBS 114.51]